MSKRSSTSIPGIYLIANTITGTVYVGQAVNIRKRWEVHRSTLAAGTHRNSYLQRAWAKYGAAAFVFSVFRDMSAVPADARAAELNEAEINCLASFQDTYNLVEAGPSGAVASATTRAILSEQLKAKWADASFRERRVLALQALHSNPEFTARRLEAVREGNRTQEAKANRSAAMKARWADPAFRSRMAAKKLANWQDPVYREKQSDACRKSWADPATRSRRTDGLSAAAQRPEVIAARTAGQAAKREQMAAAHSLLWQDPEYRARQAASRALGQAARFADPAKRAAHSARMKEAWARRRAAKCS